MSKSFFHIAEQDATFNRELLLTLGELYGGNNNDVLTFDSATSDYVPKPGGTGAGATYDLANYVDNGLLRKLPSATFTTIDVLPFSRVGREMTSNTGSFSGISYTVSVSAGTELQPAFRMFNLGDSTLANAAQFQNSTASIELLMSQSAAPTSYTLRVSDDAANAPRSWTFDAWNGTAWVTLDTRTNVAAWTAGESRTYNFTNTTNYARLRLNVTAAYNSGGIPQSETFPRTGLFFAGSNTLTSGSNTWQTSASSNNGTAWNALNGNVSDWWLSSTASNEWLAVQFPSAVTCTAVRYQLPAGLPFQHGMVTMKVQGSNNGTAWTDVATIPTQDWSTGGRDRTFNFVNGTPYLYWRLFGSTTGFGAVIGELTWTYGGATLIPFFAISELTINGTNQQIPVPSVKKWLSDAALGGNWEDMVFTQNGGNVTGTMQQGQFSLNAPVYSHPAFTPQSVTMSIVGNTLNGFDASRDAQGHVALTAKSMTLPTNGVQSLTNGTNTTAVNLGGGVWRVDAAGSGGGGLPTFPNNSVYGVPPSGPAGMYPPRTVVIGSGLDIRYVDGGPWFPGDGNTTSFNTMAWLGPQAVYLRASGSSGGAVNTQFPVVGNGSFTPITTQGFNSLGIALPTLATNWFPIISDIKLIVQANPNGGDFYFTQMIGGMFTVNNGVIQGPYWGFVKVRPVQTAFDSFAGLSQI
jgi:hypothetical protein